LGGTGTQTPESTSRARVKLEDAPRFEALLEAVKRAYRDVEAGKYRLRDLALVSTLVFTGCRLGEALRLCAGDVDPRSKTVRIMQEKKRATHPRVVPVPSKVFWDIMERYLRRIPGRDDPLFPISERQGRNIVYKFSKRYLGKRIRPHALRHSYAIFILKSTKDLEVVRRLLGHSDYKWLKVYLDYTQEDLAQELEKAFRELE